MHAGTDSREKITMKRIEVILAAEIHERLAEDTESLALKHCGLNPSLQDEAAFVMDDANWTVAAELDGETRPERNERRKNMLKMRHYLAGRIALDIVDRGEPELKTGCLPGLVRLINDLEAGLNTSTRLLGYFYRYSRRKEEERKADAHRQMDECAEASRDC